MKIEFFSVAMMVNIVAELQLQNILFECKVDDLGSGHIELIGIDTNATFTKVAA